MDADGRRETAGDVDFEEALIVLTRVIDTTVTRQQLLDDPFSDALDLTASLLVTPGRGAKKMDNRRQRL